jgi:hypothetical protein
MRYIIDIDRVENQSGLTDILSTFDANTEGIKKAACDKLDDLKREFEPKIKVTWMFDEYNEPYRNRNRNNIKSLKCYWESLQASNGLANMSQLQGIRHMANMSNAQSPYCTISNAARQLGL